MRDDSDGAAMIPVFKPSYDEREVEAVRKVLESGWTGLGPKTAEFETAFAKKMGVKFAVATNSATSALHLALKILDVSGQEVLTTPFTFVSTNHAIVQSGGRPVFCDIEPDTLNISPVSIKERIQNCKCPGAIMIVHFGGYSCDLDAIHEVAFSARNYDIPIIEDTAHGCGGEWNKKPLGTIGDLGIYSFHAVKNLSCGEGGMIVTNDRNRYERLLRLRWMGIDKSTYERSKSIYSWQYDVEEFGFKYHMSDIAAAIGLVQLEKLDDMNEKRRARVRMYNALLPESVTKPVVKPYMTQVAAHNYVIQTPDRDRLYTHLAENGVSSSVHYIPNNELEAYQEHIGYSNIRSGATPVAATAGSRVLTLPLYPDLPLVDVERICGLVTKFFNLPV